MNRKIFKILASFILSLIMILLLPYNFKVYADVENVYNGVDYSDVYDSDYYYNKYPDLRNAIGYNKKALLAHFVNFGMKEGRQAKESFNPQYYINIYPDLNKAYGDNTVMYYKHFMSFGIREGRKGNSYTYYDGYDYKDVFDANYYMQKYPDIEKAIGFNPSALFSHFVNFGIMEKRVASPNFDINVYMSRYPDLKRAYGDDYKRYYIHYFVFGIREKRSGMPDYCINGIDYSLIYDKEYYLERYPDLQNAIGDNARALISHFVSFGMKEGRQAKETFDPKYYMDTYPDLKNAYENNMQAYYQHYLNFGYKERRQASIYPLNGWANLPTGKVYYVNYIRLTGWQDIDGRKYFFDNNGILKSKTGIDVSSYQGDIDWQKVKEDGIEFAIIRIGYGNDLVYQDDSKAIRNMDMCELYNIPYGVYLYSYALNYDDVDSEISHTLRMLEGRNPSMGVYFDMEDADGYKGINGMPSNEDLCNFCIKYIEGVNAAGYTGGTYASADWFNNKLTNPMIDKYNIWLAWWTNTPDFDRDFVMWQYTSKGKVDGISGYVDMDVYLVK